MVWKLWNRLFINEVEDLRGVAISAKLEGGEVGGKGGKEKGQGMLGFEKVEKGKGKEVTLVAGPSKVVKPIRKEVSIIILDSDSDSSSPPPPPPLPPRPISPKKKKAPPVYIPTMFKKQSISSKSLSIPPASQISDLELTSMDMDPEVYRGLPKEVQEMVMKDFKNSRKGLSYTTSTLKGQTTLSGKSSKPGTSSSSNNKSKSVEPTPDPPVPASPPIEITDEAILKLGYSLETFRELPVSIQMDILRTSRKQMKSLTVTADRPSEKNRIQTPLIKVVPFHPIPPPTFYGKTLLEDLRYHLERWDLDQAPGEEVGLFIQYLEKIVDVRKMGQGRDLNKVKSLMEWWEYLIDERFGNFGLCERLEETDGILWWESYKRAKERIQFLVSKEFGVGCVLIS